MSKGNTMKPEDIDVQSIPTEDKPIPKNKKQKLRYFLGLFGAEHVAATEFVIGATFVIWGVSAGDVLIGLIVGNLLAVLTWTFLCAPIATDTGLTLYSYLKKIAGPHMQKVYNAVNGILYCILGGAMITVSASAVRLIFDIPVQTNWYPTSASFVALVLVIGAIVAVIAALGFKSVAQFSTVCAPWLLVIFICGALVALPQLVSNSATVNSLGSFQDFMQLANENVWVAGAEGSLGLNIWHVIAFAWIANLAMHGGMSDMAIFRYAKSYKYGFASILGMFFGHYIAWISAGIMGATSAMLLNTTVSNIDSGEVAYQVLGYIGVVAVIIAGWTTANPTLYRSGLAFQTIFYKYSVTRVTLMTGALTTIIACFPFVFTGLLDFVGYMGLILLPIGTIVVTEHWIFPKIGFTRYWAQYKKVNINVPALITWVVSVGFVVIMDLSGTLHLYFLAVPTYFLAMILYIVLAKMAGAKEAYPEEEAKEKAFQEAIRLEQENEDKFTKSEADTPLPSSITANILGVTAILNIAALVGLSFGVFFGAISFATFNIIALVVTIVYFIAATFWMKLKDKAT